MIILQPKECEITSLCPHRRNPNHQIGAITKFGNMGKHKPTTLLLLSHLYK